MCGTKTYRRGKDDGLKQLKIIKLLKQIEYAFDPPHSNILHEHTNIFTQKAKNFYLPPPPQGGYTKCACNAANQY